MRSAMPGFARAMTAPPPMTAAALTMSGPGTGAKNVLKARVKRSPSSAAATLANVLIAPHLMKLFSALSSATTRS